MATAHNLLSEDQLLCSICLDVFDKPVSIPCGHNFCRSCITDYWEWDGAENWQCPLCKNTFARRPDLKVNTLISELAVQFKASVGDTGSSPDEHSEHVAVEVVCDICTETKVKALKSCLDCLVSYCESHLEPHHRLAGLKRHNLIDPVENLEDRICTEHNRLLTLFCRKDLVCLCEVCAGASHKTHETVPLQEEYKLRKAQLGKTEVKVRQTIREKLQKVQEIEHTVKQSRKEAEIERAKIVEKQKATEKEAEESIKDLEKEITDLRERGTQLKILLHTEDPLHLLQNLPTQSIPPQAKSSHLLQNLPTQSIPPQQAKSRSRVSVDSCQEIKDMVRSLTSMSQGDLTLDELGSALNEFCQLNEVYDDVLSEAAMLRIQRHEVDVILDPETAHRKLYLSRDGKQVKYDSKTSKQSLHGNAKRFDNYLAVLGKRGYSSGKFYYEVEVGRKDEWNLGVASKYVNRKGGLGMNPECGFWTIGFRVDSYEAYTNPRVPADGRKADTVGVFVDYEEGEVSFYDVENRGLIYSFTGYTFTEKLYPYLNPCDDEFPSNIAPLVISPVRK